MLNRKPFFLVFLRCGINTSVCSLFSISSSSANRNIIVKKKKKHSRERKKIKYKTQINETTQQFKITQYQWNKKREQTCVCKTKILQSEHIKKQIVEIFYYQVLGVYWYNYNNIMILSLIIELSLWILFRFHNKPAACRFSTEANHRRRSFEQASIVKWSINQFFKEILFDFCMQQQNLKPLTWDGECVNSPSWIVH